MADYECICDKCLDGDDLENCETRYCASRHIGIVRNLLEQQAGQEIEKVFFTTGRGIADEF